MSEDAGRVESPGPSPDPRTGMRRRWLLGVLAMAMAWMVLSTSVPRAQSNLVAAYAMNEGSGTSLADWTGKGHTGTLSGATWTPAGRFGGALSFDGVNDWVTVADAADLDLTTGLTLEAWVYPTVSGGGSWRNVLIKERTGGEVYNLYANADTNAPTAYVVTAGSPGTALDARGTSALPLDSWSHVTLTYDNTALRLYVNGVQVGTRAVAGPLLTSTGVLRLGGNSIWGEYFAGVLDEVRIYNRALTVSEIQADMNTAVGAPDTTAPTLSGGAPSGVLAAGTTATTLSLATNENASCRYATTAGVAYGSMPSVFTTTGGVAHMTTVTGLMNGASYTFYVRCADASGNATTSDYLINFAVAQVGGDTMPPTIAIDSPPSQASVAGMITIVASAADNVGVAGVQFLVDGENVGSEVIAEPYRVTWDTSTAPLGTHVLTARARDAAGNTALSPPIDVNVANNPVPPDFVDEVVIGSGLTFPTAFEFLPDGRMLVTEFRGRVLVLQPGASVVDGTPVLQLPNIFLEDVTAGGERGLVNLVTDPDFSTNGFIYLFYTAAIPQRDRVSRFTMSGHTADPSTEVVIWQAVADSTNTDHHGGALGFGPDGRLYISTGDNGDPPSSQPLSSDHGKILRVNKDGSIPSDNPFVDGAGPNVDAIWARGLRNPYRFSFDATTSRMFIGDVGQNLTEELDLGIAGANYGWPTCEGPCNNAGMTNPLFTYAHDGRDAAITGGFVYRGTQFPAAYQGTYFYGDFAQNWIRYLTLNSAGAVTSDNQFLPADGSLDGPYDPVMLKPGPDGSLYYVDFGWGWLGPVNPAAIRRIRFESGNQAPAALASATPSLGQAPLSVAFSSDGSFDPEGHPVSYLWKFGDGNTSTTANPVHVYSESGLYSATLDVSDGTLTTTSGAIAISVGNPPEQAITSPVNGALFRAGDMITFSGLATDPEDGVLPSSAYTWTVLFHHDSHVHPTLGPVSGITSGTFTVPTSGHDFSGTTFYEFILTTTDSTGLQTTSSANVYPRKVNLTLTASHPGLTVTVDGITRSAPYVKDTLTGFQHAIGAPNQALGPVNYGFVSWSDGGAQAHSIVAGENDATYLATFQASTVTASPTSATVLTGTMSSGTVAALLSDDNVYYAVASTTSGTRTAAWYGAFTGVTNDLSNLRINYKGRNSANCTQTIAVWNWQTSAWVQLDSRTVGSTEVAINNVTPSGTLADYVSGASGSGELRVRVQCTANANRTSQGDLMSIVYDQPIGPDTTAPVLSNGVPSGTLPSGTTQATISLASNESATCRFGPTPGTDYASLPFAFSATGGLSHSSSLTGLTDGTSYAVFARCQDLAGNANQSDFGISFSVALPDLTPPSVSITSPAPGATVAGVVTVVATASDNVGVAGVQFLLDGVPLGAEDGTAPYSVDWTTSSVPNGGPYELTARARDATGYQTVSTAVNVTVNNSVFPGLVAAYGFEDGTGNVLTDNSGRGHPGSITGATWTTAGRFGQALTFDGINDWVTIADAADLDLTSGMTLEAWVYPTALGNGSWRNVLIKERPKGEIYSLYASADTNAPTAYVVRAAQSSVALDVRGSSQLPLNAWSHLTVTFDNATLRIYVDGVQVGARAVAGPLLTSSGVLRIGGNKIWGEYFAGRIDNLRIYNRALSESQIQTDMSTPVQP